MHVETLPGPIPAARVSGIDLRSIDARTAAELKRLVYERHVVVFRQGRLDERELLQVADKFGAIERYFQSNYHHPEYPDIFVSTNLLKDGKKVGVKGTGRYWHCDYQFFPRPFSLILLYPVVLPSTRRTTLFVDMGAALERVPHDLRALLQNGVSVHDCRYKYKIQPSDIDKALDEVLDEVSRLVPPLRRRPIVTHPVSKRPVLFMSPGFTAGLDGLSRDENVTLMKRLFDPIVREEHVFACDLEEGDLLVWDNISLIHRAGPVRPEDPSMNYRVTVYDRDPGASPTFLGAVDDVTAAVG